MKEHHFLCGLAIIALSVMYLFYVTITKGDGIAFAAITGAITAIIGYNYGLRRSAIVKKE